MKKTILLVLALAMVGTLCACAPEDVIPVDKQDVESAFEDIFSSTEEDTDPVEFQTQAEDYEEDGEEVVGTATGPDLEVITENLQDDYIQDS